MDVGLATVETNVAAATPADQVTVDVSFGDVATVSTQAAQADTLDLSVAFGPVTATGGEDVTVLPDPVLPETCWPVNTSCCPDWDTYDLETRQFAEAMAGQTLRSLTAYRVGGCPVTVRPCLESCTPDRFITAPVYGGFSPHVNPLGAWVNGCGCVRDCSCTRLCVVRLPAPVGWVGEVRLDGQVLPASAYRVDNGNELVRTDGGCWPSCQRMDAPDTEDGTFSVTYLNAHLVDTTGAYAAGVLACEFAAACSGGDCRLPPNVTELSRQGVTMTIEPGVFPNGVTGIREVDAYVRRWNPNLLKLPPVVTSPDMRRPRRTTIP